MAILSSDSPNPEFTLGSCPSGAPVDSIEQTVNSGGSSLSYDPVADQHVYVWKTDKNWVGKCGSFTVTLADGTGRCHVPSLLSGRA